MPNIKSAIKRNKQNEKRRLRNRHFMGKARSFIKNARLAMEGDDLAEAREATLMAIRALDKAAEKGILHKNNVARRKSRLIRRLNQMEKQEA